MSATLEKRKHKSYEIFNQIAGSYDFLNRLLSMGIDKIWRKKLISKLDSKRNLKVLDLASGTGDLAFELANSQKTAEVIGADLSSGMIKLAKEKNIRFSNKEKLNFEIQDGCNLSYEDQSFDAATISFGIRNFPDTLKGLQEMYRVLRPGGKCYVLEFSIPKNMLIRNIYFIYFRYILPFIGNLVSGHKDAYSYLNQTVETYPHGKAFGSIMKEAKLENIEYHMLSFGICTLYIGEKPNA